MEKLLYYRQVLRKYYAAGSTYITMLAKFLLSFFVFRAVNACFGAVPLLSRTVIVLGAALLCSIFPWGAVTLTAAVWLLAQLYFFSQEAALLMFVLLLVVAVLKYITLPGASIVMVLLPLLFLWRIPFAVPLIVGLAGGLSSFEAVGFGVLIYSFLKTFSAVVPTMNGEEAVTFVERLLYLMRSIAGCKEMYFLAGSFCVVTLVVHLISHLTLPFAEYIGIGVGGILCAVLLLTGASTFGLDFPTWNVIGGALLALLLAVLYQFFTLALEYSKTERVRFEDDDFVYYVKAVPKVVVPERNRDKSDTDVFSEADQALILAVSEENSGAAEENREKEGES